MTLTELKAKATELGLTPDDVRQYGSLSKKTTWEAAIDAIGRKSEAVETVKNIAATVNQSSRPGGHHEKKPLTVGTEDGVGIDGELVAASEVVNPDNRWHSFRIETIVNTATDDFVQKQLPPSEPIPPIEPETVDMEGWHRWDEKLKVWVKENPEETLKDCYQPESDSLRDQLLKRMQPYVGDCIRLEDFEKLQNEPLDEPTAAMYIGWLEGSERILAEATT